MQRRTHHRFSPSDMAAGELPVHGLALDVEAEFDVSAAETCGIEVAVAPDGEEKAAIVYERETATLSIHRQYSGDDAAIDSAPQGLAHRLDAGEMLQLRILLDGSVLEVIANGRTRVTSRFYPSSKDSDGVRIVAPARLRRWISGSWHPPSDRASRMGSARLTPLVDPLYHKLFV